ncbi:cobalamin biosynthesis protein CbiG [Salmonella enterica subsp. enterica serovar Typhimurium]|nr:cobalamin biosynthesis protein CbiG [Salmonella enterica subsp. enterica serovar Typhimurium]
MNTVKPESIALFCLTPGGVALAKRLAAMLPLTCFTSEKLREEGFIPFDGGFANTARQAFTTYTALIFIGADRHCRSCPGAVSERQVQRSGGGRH